MKLWCHHFTCFTITRFATSLLWPGGDSTRVVLRAREHGKSTPGAFHATGARQSLRMHPRRDSRRTARFALLLLGALLLLSACGGRPPTLARDARMESDPADPDDMTWTRLGDVTERSESGRVTLSSEESGYHLRLNDERHVDVVLEVQTEQISPRDLNAFGVACRVTEDEGVVRGYLFLIAGDGHYAILRVDGSLLDAEPLVPWQKSMRIRQGMTDNALRAECVGNELALHVNGYRLAHIVDPRPLQEGHAGLVIGVVEGMALPEAGEAPGTEEATLATVVGADPHPVEIAFDDLQITEVLPGRN